MNNPFKALHQRLFMQGQETVAKGVSVELFEEQTDLINRAGKAAVEAIELAEQLGADGDPYKREVAEILKAGVVESLGAMQQVASGRMKAGEAKEALQTDPFSVDSAPSAMSLPSEPESSKALGHESNGQAPKRGPGRPKKNSQSEEGRQVPPT